MKNLNTVFLLLSFTTFIKAESNCWSEPEYPCCKGPEYYNVYVDDKGSWAVENNQWCGIPKEDQPQQNQTEEGCWSEKLGYPCCKTQTEIAESDSDGDWGVEDGKWCGIPKEQKHECLFLKIGFPCCQSQNATVYYTDEYGEWGVENNNWCGIRYLKQTKEICWSMNLSTPYPCCTGKDLEIVKEDSNGKWSKENGNLCGIPVIQEIDPSSSSKDCWSIDAYGYKCCKYDYIKPNYKTGDGFWYHFDKTDEWCAYRYGSPAWNDRAGVFNTKAEWASFKSKWGEGKEIDVNNFQRLSVFPGSDESQLNFGWYSTTNKTTVIRFGETKNLTEDNEVSGKNYLCKNINNVQYYCNQVTVNELKRKSTYYYQRKLNDVWEDVIEFNTQDPENYRIVFLGDPQIGASRNNYSMFTKHGLSDEEGLRNDAFNWNMTIYNSYQKANKASLIISAGDNADSGESGSDPYDLFRQEREYSTLLLPQLMQQVPFAAAVGNHESVTQTYRYHFNTPNSYKEGRDESTPGYSYFFKHNNALIIVLESNYGDKEEYSNVLKNANDTYPNVDWRIVLFHHDIYSNGATHSTEYRVMELRDMLTSLFDQYKIDLVINGHDHMYAASHFISYDSNSQDKFKFDKIKTNKVYENKNGTMYITANCSTGSKLYDIYGDVDFINFSNQTYTSTFGILDVSKNEGKTQLKITSYEVDTLNTTDGPYIFQKDAVEVPHETPKECWAIPLGFPCCTSENPEVLFVDDDGNWSVENNEWCGILEN